uniref:Uncharacterized protein n=1 Tax=Opuntia streptacantha TaxID=393608 RepID=A0A7C9AJ26_OPUST
MYPDPSNLSSNLSNQLRGAADLRGIGNARGTKDEIGTGERCELQTKPRCEQGISQMNYRNARQRGFKRGRYEIWRLLLPLSGGHGVELKSVGQRTNSLRVSLSTFLSNKSKS